MDTIKKVLNWLIVSSVDPTKVALTVKGFLTALVSFLVLASPLLKVQFEQESLMNVVEALTQLILQVLTLIASIVSAYGLFRKIDLSIRQG